MTYLKPNSQIKDKYKNILITIQEQIDSLQNEIIDIKKARFNKQTNK